MGPDKIAELDATIDQLGIAGQVFSLVERDNRMYITLDFGRQMMAIGRIRYMRGFLSNEMTVANLSFEFGYLDALVEGIKAGEHGEIVADSHAKRKGWHRLAPGVEPAGIRVNHAQRLGYCDSCRRSDVLLRDDGRLTLHDDMAGVSCTANRLQSPSLLSR